MEVSVTSDPGYRIRSEAALELSKEAHNTRERLDFVKLAVRWHNLALEAEQHNDRPADKGDKPA
jgi:hypothetical protein